MLDGELNGLLVGWLDLDGRLDEKSDLLGHLESASHMVEEPSVQYL